MTKVLTFSRTFPAYHPKKGQPTYFVEKFYNSIYRENGDWSEAPGDVSNYVVELDSTIKELKNHTIRGGHRFKAGDYFSPAVWGSNINPKNGRSGPYQSNQIKIASDTRVEKTWDFEIRGDQFFINNELFYHQHVSEWHSEIEKLAQNDGLSCRDLFDWFLLSPDFKKKKCLVGQIICWNENINY